MNEIFRKRLKGLLKAHKMNYAEFSKKIGVCKSSIDRYISGESDIPASRIVAIAKLFGVSVDWLLGLAEDIKPAKKPKEPPKAETMPVKPRTKKIIILTPEMDEEQLELLVMAYTGLSREAVHGLHNSRAIQVKWSTTR